MAWYIDWAYDHFVARPGETFAAFSAAVLDSRLIDGAVNGVATVVRVGGERLRRIQSGYVRSYALGIVAGLVVLAAYVLSRAGS
jgi:NADH-quinone oxidoreductase subunit L